MGFLLSELWYLSLWNLSESLNSGGITWVYINISNLYLNYRVFNELFFWVYTCISFLVCWHKSVAIFSAAHWYSVFSATWARGDWTSCGWICPHNIILANGLWREIAFLTSRLDHFIADSGLNSLSPASAIVEMTEVEFLSAWVSEKL